MIIVKMMGGLGNQMFQYAFGQALQNEIVLYDIDTIYNDEEYLGIKRKYILDSFNTNVESILANKIKLLDGRKSILRRIVNKLSINPNKIKAKLIIEKSPAVFDPELLQVSSKHVYYEGYFQTEKYFIGIRTQILQDFTLKNALDIQNQEMLDEILSTNAISLHIRRGDYLNLDVIICSLEYYKSAIAKIVSEVENPHFFLFSDDPDWVKENLKLDYPCTFVNFNSEEEKAYCDIWLMKHCKHNIIANSSFSWWGAWLNENENKIIIAPKPWWFRQSDSSSFGDIVPDSWICINPDS